MKLFIPQEYHDYTLEDHDVWSTLYTRQSKMINTYGSKEFQAGYTSLLFETDKIPELKKLNMKLNDISGWSLLGVKGLLPTKEFFDVLIQKKYPVSVRIRRREELDFSEQPDIFHDICGHVPMLINNNFQNFLMNFGKVGSKYLGNEFAIECLSRFYWYTIEMGLVNESGKIHPYGAAILTSKGEINNVYNPAIPKLNFEIKKIINTPYDMKLQSSYFVIDDFAELDKGLIALDQLLDQQIHVKNISI